MTAYFVWHGDLPNEVKPPASAENKTGARVTPVMEIVGDPEDLLNPENDALQASLSEHQPVFYDFGDIMGGASI